MQAGPIDQLHGIGLKSGGLGSAESKRFIITYVFEGKYNVLGTMLF